MSKSVKILIFLTPLFQTLPLPLVGSDGAVQIQKFTKCFKICETPSNSIQHVKKVIMKDPFHDKSCPYYYKIIPCFNAYID